MSYKLQGRRFEETSFKYDGLSELLPSGEYRLEVTFYTRIDGKKRNLYRSKYLGTLETTTAEQWR